MGTNSKIKPLPRKKPARTGNVPAERFISGPTPVGATIQAAAKGPVFSYFSLCLNAKKPAFENDWDKARAVGGDPGQWVRNGSPSE